MLCFSIKTMTLDDFYDEVSTDILDSAFSDVFGTAKEGTIEEHELSL